MKTAGGNFSSKNVIAGVNGHVPFGFWGMNNFAIDVNGFALKKSALYFAGGFFGIVAAGPNISLNSNGNDASMIIGKLD